MVDGLGFRSDYRQGQGVVIEKRIKQQKGQKENQAPRGDDTENQAANEYQGIKQQRIQQQKRQDTDTHKPTLAV